jgi:hypothetical protein
MEEGKRIDQKSKPQSASMTARFRNPSKQEGCPGTFPKAQMIIADRKTSEEIFLCVSFECDSLSERLGREKIVWVEVE